MKAELDYLPSARLFDTDWSVLSDAELLTLLLSSRSEEADTLPTACRLLQEEGSLNRLKDLSYRDLRERGLQRASALALRAGIELSLRLRSPKFRPGTPFRSSREVFDHFRPRMQDLKKECFWNLLLDGKNRISRIVRVSEGSLTSSLVHPREVFRPAIREAAAALLFVHNHPSGDPSPSREDLQITRRLVETGKVVGISALDHVIIGARSYFSFADQGLL